MATTLNDFKRTRVRYPGKLDDGVTQYVTPIPFTDVSINKSAGETIVMTGYKGLTGTGAKTVAGWFDFSSSHIVTMYNWGSGGSGEQIWFRLNFGSLMLIVGGNSNYVLGDTTGIHSGGFHHLAFTVPASANLADVRLYVDGQPETESYNGTDPAIDTASGADVHVYSYSTPAANWGFAGTANMSAIWDVELSAASILDLYNDGTAFDWTANSGDYTNSGDLVKYFPCRVAEGDGGVSTTLHEVIDGSPDGTFADGLTADDWVEDTPPSEDE